MNKLFTLIIFIAISHASFSQAQWSWAKQLAGRDNTSGGAYLGMDNTGSLYMAGDFTGTRNFGASSLTASGSSDLFITKMDSAGNIQWAERAGGNSSSYVDVRAAYTTPAGVTYITGKFNGTVTFGTTTVTATSSFDDMFIVRYQANGTVDMVERFGGSGGSAGTTEGRGIVVDNTGNIYVTGAFSSTVDFGAYQVVAQHQFNTDMFTLKMDATGTVLWAQRGGSATQEDKGNGIDIDNNGNVYVAGAYKQTADFGSINLTSTGIKDMFIVKYTSAGAVDWAIKAGGTTSGPNTPAAEANAIKVDANGNIYVTGTMNGNNVIFGPGVSLNEIQQSNAFYGDFFLAKYNSAGVVQWARNGGGSSVTDAGNAIDLDTQGNVYVTGSFQGANANFNGQYLTSSGIGDVFVVKYTPTGTISWAQKLGAGNDDVGLSIIADASNKAYVSGYFTGNITAGSSTITSPPGTWQVFLARIDAGSTSINEVYSVSFDVYPNPVKNILFVEGKNLTSIELLDMAGRVVYAGEITDLKSTHDVSHLEGGVYFIKVSDQIGSSTRKIVIR